MSVIRSTIKMAIATFFSRIFGLVREQVMAAYFGASGMTDAFLVAFRIPNLLRDLFAEGAFSSAFVPTFIEANQESFEKSRELMWSLFWLLFFITGTVCLGIFIFAPELVSIFAPSFTKDPEKFIVTVNLTRIMAPFLTFVSLAALFMGVLNSLKVFFVPAFAPTWFNIVSVICQVGLSGLLYKNGYHPIYSLGIGAMLGGFAQAAVQVPKLIQFGYKPMWPKKFWTDRSKKIVKLIGPGLIGFAAAQINILITTILATPIVGAVSWLSYSFRLFQLPVGILSVSIGNSNMVHFSEAWKKKDVDGAKASLQQSYYLSLLTVMPALVMLYCLSEEMINLIFERGKFTHVSTLMTAEALRMYALGLPFYGLYKILVPTFYALDRQKIPVMASIFSIAFNISFCLLLTPIFGFKILALGTTLSVLVNSCFQSWVLKKDLNLSWNFFFSLRIWKVVGATVGCAVITETLLKVEFFSQPFITKCFYLGVQILAIGALYATFLLLMGERAAVNALLSKVTKKFRKK
ncbi:murein biosynthesis integral membrane protein MurJ [Peredibacter sp. HCB2-198]|uniref:murein biosynthesis integral membrane protein MurJ n=1 Tax=Peredibacter sp. HCB2-198 TaxID=3383025 RepID=UPI0038B4339D